MPIFLEIAMKSLNEKTIRLDERWECRHLNSSFSRVLLSCRQLKHHFSCPNETFMVP